MKTHFLQQLCYSAELLTATHNPASRKLNWLTRGLQHAKVKVVGLMWLSRTILRWKPHHDSMAHLLHLRAVSGLNTQSNTFLHATVNAVGSSSFLFHRVHKCEYQKSKADWRACIIEGCDARARSIHLVIFWGWWCSCPDSPILDVHLKVPSDSTIFLDETIPTTCKYLCWNCLN